MKAQLFLLILMWLYENDAMGVPTHVEGKVQRLRAKYGKHVRTGVKIYTAARILRKGGMRNVLQRGLTRAGL